MSNFQYIEAPAKLNLNLFITGVNQKGLHLLKSHVCFLELKDICICQNLDVKKAYAPLGFKQNLSSLLSIKHRQNIL